MVAPPHDSCAAANASVFDRVEVVVEPGDRRRVGGHDVELFLADRGEDLELFGRHRAGVTAFAVGGGDRFEASSGADVRDGHTGRRCDVPLGGEPAFLVAPRVREGDPDQPPMVSCSCSVSSTGCQ